MNSLPKSIENVVQLYRSNLEYSLKKDLDFLKGLKRVRNVPVPYRLKRHMEFFTFGFLSEMQTVTEDDDKTHVFDSYFAFIDSVSLSTKTKFLMKALMTEFEQEVSGWDEDDKIRRKECYRTMYEHLWYTCIDFRAMSAELKFVLKGDMSRTHPAARMLLQGREEEIEQAATRYLRSREQPVLVHGVPVSFIADGSC